MRLESIQAYDWMWETKKRIEPEEPFVRCKICGEKIFEYELAFERGIHDQCDEEVKQLALAIKMGGRL